MLQVVAADGSMSRGSSPSQPYRDKQLYQVDFMVTRETLKRRLDRQQGLFTGLRQGHEKVGRHAF